MDVLQLGGVILAIKMKEIPLTNSELFALVDDEDYEIVSEHDWHFNKGYAETRIYRNTISLHRFVLGLKRGDGIYVDHINDDGLHNYKSNLRKCTNQENIRNRRKQIKRVSSVYKGVSWDRTSNKWSSKIKYDRKKIHIGTFDCEKMAAKAYDIYADKYFGEFARLNFPDELNDGSVILPERKTSKYYGVSYNKQRQRWVVQVNGKFYCRVKTELEAAQKVNEILVNVYNEPPKNTI